MNKLIDAIDQVIEENNLPHEVKRNFYRTQTT